MDLRGLRKNTLEGLQTLSGVLLLLGLLCSGPQSAIGAEDRNEAAAAQPVLTLEAVIRMALETNRTLIGSRYGVEGRRLGLQGTQAEFEWKLAPGADAAANDENRSFGAGVVLEKKFTLGPVASVGPKVVRTHDDLLGDDYSGEVELALTVPLLRGFGREVNLSAVRAAEYALRTAQRSHQLAQVNTVLTTVGAVYDIVQQRELVGYYQEQTERLRHHAILARAKERVHLATPIDTYRAEIRLQDALGSLNRAKEAVRNAGDRLNLILATPLELAVRVEAPLDFKALDISLDTAIATALKNRIELKQVADDLQEARRASRVSKSDLLPNLDILSSYTRSGRDDRLEEALDLNEDRWSISLSSSTDWSRTAEKAAYQQSLLTVKMTRLNRLTRIDSIKQEIRQYFDALQKAEERIQIRKEQMEQARGKLALSNVKFSHGLADNFDVIEAETELQTARVNWLAERVDHILSRYRLRAAMGTLIQ
jgi:outer membrane protein